jgi:hypothetical protein
MTDRNAYRLGPDIPPGQPLRDSEGRLVDDAYVDEAMEEAIQVVRGRGRPSLSRSGESPLLRVRISNGSWTTQFGRQRRALVRPARSG